MNSLKEYEDKAFHHVADQDDAVADKEMEEASEKAQKEHQSDIERVKKGLENKVSDVRFTSRLVNAPSSVVAGKDELTPHMHQLNERGWPASARL